MDAMASQITRLTIVYSTVYSGADQRKHQSPASLAFVRGIHMWPVNFPHKGSVTRKMFPFDDVTMEKVWVIVGVEASNSSNRSAFVPQYMPLSIHSVRVFLCFLVILYRPSSSIFVIVAVMAYGGYCIINPNPVMMSWGTLVNNHMINN